MSAPGDPEPTAAELEAEAEEHWQAAYEAMYGTPAEQAADAAIGEAEAIVSGVFGGYLTGTCILPGLDGPAEPEAEL